MSNQSLFIDTNLTATYDFGAVDNLAIKNTIGEVKGTREKYRTYTKKTGLK